MVLKLYPSIKRGAGVSHIDRLNCKTMFQVPILLGDNSNRLALETNRKHPIENDVAPDIGDRERQLYILLRKRYGTHWQARKPACGRYNCFGLLFAARRTSIRKDLEVSKILVDDGYRRLLAGESVIEGDLALYSARASGTLLHGGVVVRVERLTGSGPADSVSLRILSKWNDVMGEDVHHVNHIPYDDPESTVTVEYWTERP